MAQLIKSGHELTVRLYLERQEIIERHAQTKKSLSILFENSARRQALSDKIEERQLNEISKVYKRYYRDLRSDFYSRVARETIRELQEAGLIVGGPPTLNEGFWDSVQAGVGNFAGGVDDLLKKIKIKKEPKNWKQAQDIFTKVLSKESSKLVKDLLTKIDQETKTSESDLETEKESDKIFPVNKTKEIFLQGIATLGAFYDSIVEAAGKNPNEDGYMAPAVANEIIEQLRIAVQKYMSDTEREKGGMYATFGGVEKKKQKDEEAPEASQTESSFRSGNFLFEKKEEDSKIDPEKEYEAIMRGQSSPVFTRMTSLKGPAVVAAAGALLGGLGWVAQQPWFHDFILRVLHIPQEETITVDTSPKEIADKIPDALSDANPDLEHMDQVVGTVKSDGTGLCGQVSRILGLDSSHDLLGSDASIENLRAAALQAGGGDLDQGLHNIAELTRGRGRPEEAFNLMKAAIEHPEKFGAHDIHDKGSLWKLFAGKTVRAGGVHAHAMGHPGVFSVQPGNALMVTFTKVAFKAVAKMAVKHYVKSSVSVVAKTAAAAKWAGIMSSAGTVAAALGIAMVTSGATVAALRMKAKKSSRLATLNVLLQSLKSIESKPVPGVKATEGAKATIVLLDDRTLMDFEGFAGNPEIEKASGNGQLTLPLVPISKVEIGGAKSIDDLPDTKKEIGSRLPSLDLKNLEIKIVDERSEEQEAITGGGAGEKGGEKSGPGPSGVSVNLPDIENAGGAVVVFDDDAIRVWRVLKKNSLKQSFERAKKVYPDDASTKELGNRFSDYDKLLGSMRSDGNFVDVDTMKSLLSKISTGTSGGKSLKVNYLKKPKGKPAKIATVGGYTMTPSVSSVRDIRNNIKTSNAGTKPAKRDDMQIAYLVSSKVLDGLKKDGMPEKDAKEIVAKAIKAWTDSGKKPKIGDIGLTDDQKVTNLLRRASLVEAFGFQKQRYAIVEVTEDLLRRIVLDLNRA